MPGSGPSIGFIISVIIFVIVIAAILVITGLLFYWMHKNEKEAQENKKRWQDADPNIPVLIYMGHTALRLLALRGQTTLRAFRNAMDPDFFRNPPEDITFDNPIILLTDLDDKISYKLRSKKLFERETDEEKMKIVSKDEFLSALAARFGTKDDIDNVFASLRWMHHFLNR